MSLKRIYIAGPMRGYPLYNFPAFDVAAAAFRNAGWDVVNPADLDRSVGITETTDPLPPKFMQGAMKRDLVAICDCQAIALLPGWQKSSGVKVELALAELLALAVYDADTMQLIPADILHEAFRLTRGDRNDDYGHPLDEHDVIARGWSIILKTDVSAENVAECMIWLKLARNQHKRKRDNWTDIAGYADCGHRIVEERKRRDAEAD